MPLLVSPPGSRYLWPIAFGISGIIHVAVLGSIRLVWVTPKITPTLSRPTPIRLVDPPSPAEGLPPWPTFPSRVSTPPLFPESASPPTETVHNAPHLTSEPPLQTLDPLTTAPTPAPTIPDQLEPIPIPSALDPPVLDPLQSTESSSTEPLPEASGGDPDAANSMTAAQTGQLVPIAISPDRAGRDLPDTLPEFVANAVWIQPLLLGCGWSQWPRLRTVSVQMRLTVEIDGRISQTEILEGSGDSAVDQLMQCLVKQGLQLRPAVTAGAAQPTDAAILEVQARF